MPTDPRVDAYIAARAEFARPILAEIRRRIHAACPEVEETIRWSMPSFGYRGQIMANMSAFKTHAACGFWKRQDMATGREGEAMGQFGRLAGIDDLPSAPEFEAMVHQAMAMIEAGKGKIARETKAPRPDAEVPPMLAEALAGDEQATATFNAFPPGARRDYCEWIAEARRDETRVRRVADAVQWLREGKKRHWKYENC